MLEEMKTLDNQGGIYWVRLDAKAPQWVVHYYADHYTNQPQVLYRGLHRDCKRVAEMRCKLCLDHPNGSPTQTHLKEHF